MFSWFSGKKTAEDERFLEILRPGGLAVLSASCCNPTAHAVDEQLLGRLRSACEAVGRDPLSIRVETITDCRAAISRLMPNLEEREGALVQKITALFMSSGMDVFPMVIVDGELAFYGGAPEQDKLEGKLRGTSSVQAAGISAAS
jgi:hypothetical protein